jgi:hypothetical protein
MFNSVYYRKLLHISLTLYQFTKYNSINQLYIYSKYTFRILFIHLTLINKLIIIKYHFKL